MGNFQSANHRMNLIFFVGLIQMFFVPIQFLSYITYNGYDANMCTMSSFSVDKNNMLVKEWRKIPEITGSVGKNIKLS